MDFPIMIREIKKPHVIRDIQVNLICVAYSLFISNICHRKLFYFHSSIFFVVEFFFLLYIEALNVKFSIYYYKTFRKYDSTSAANCKLNKHI